MSGRIGDGDSTSEKKQHNLNPNTHCAGGVKTALYILNLKKERCFLPCLKTGVSTPKNLMKDTHVIAVACGIALIAIVCVFIGYATDTLPKHVPRVITPSLQTSEKSTAKKRECPCCEEDFLKNLHEVVYKDIEKKTIGSRR